MSKEKAAAIGKHKQYFISRVTDPSDEEANNDDIENLEIKLYLNKKLAVEVAKILNKSIYDLHRDLAKAIKQISK